jgi:endo-1,4-beta-xylanase
MNLRSVCVASIAAAVLATAAVAQSPTSLKQAFKPDFPIGVAINQWQIFGQNKKDDAIIISQFDSISPENVLKWERVHPKPGHYNFGPADAYVAFGQKHHMWIVGHNLVWHSQVPAWVFRDKDGKLLTRDALLQRMRKHIFTVVGRYKGRIQSWDVVNEALNEDGTLRQSLWEKIIGPDYIAKAFEYAHEADPKAQLTYNDYNLASPAKRDGLIALVKKLKAEGVPIDCIGMQMHVNLTSPTAEQVDEAITDYAKLGVKVDVSEMDIDVLPQATMHQTADVNVKVAANAKLNPYAKGLPAAVQKELTERYASLFRVFLKHRAVMSRVTLWGVTDADSWKNNWPVPGRTNYPLLFNRDGKPKPAYFAIIREAEAVNAGHGAH